MKQIKLFDPIIGKEEFKALKQVLSSHFWASGSGIGYVLRFENEFRKYIESNTCIAVNNGTSALNLALSLFDVDKAEVIVPSLTFVSTIHAIVLNNAIPVFADVDPQTLCIDPEKVKHLITKKTKAILPVHFAGMSCDLNSLNRICKKNNLVLIEDAAHAAGATYQNQKIGKNGNAVCFSFHPVKNLAMPTGGLISINHKDYKKFREKLLAKRWCGITNRKGNFYDVKELGWNYYMNEFSAVIGLCQLKKLDIMNSIRRKIAKRYSKEINLNKKMLYDENCSYHFYWIQTKNRTRFLKKMLKKSIECGIHYRPVHTMSLYRSYVKLPITEKAGQEIISLPTHPNLSNSDVDRIITTVNEILD